MVEYFGKVFRPSKDLPVRVRGCAMIKRANHILVLKYNYPGGTVYALPGGGVDNGESLGESVVRECREELKIDIKLGPLRYVGDMRATPQLAQTLHLVFEAELVEGEPKIDPSQTSALECVWLPIDDIATHRLYPAVNQEIIQDKDTDQVGARYLGYSLSREWV